MVTVWWSAWLAANFIGRAGARMLRPDAAEDLLLPGLAAVTLFQLVWVAAAALAINVIRGVENRQRMTIAALAGVVPGRLAR